VIASGPRYETSLAPRPSYIRRPLLARTVCALVALLVSLASGCYRPSPPELPTFKPPAARAAEEEEEPEAAEAAVPAASPAGVIEPEVAEPQLAPPPPVEVALPAPAVVEAVAAPAAAPTIVGSWRIIEASSGGQPQEGMENMEMIFTFTADGVVRMSVSGPEMPQPMTMEGTYTTTGDQITMTLAGQTQTGTYELSGNQLKLHVPDGEATLERV